MMKKTFILLLTLIYFAAFLGVAAAQERRAQLTIPGCSA